MSAKEWQLMRYRVISGGPAARLEPKRAASAPKEPPAAPAAPASNAPAPPTAAELNNPYYRCFAKPRGKTK